MINFKMVKDLNWMVKWMKGFVNKKFLNIISEQGCTQKEK